MFLNLKVERSRGRVNAWKTSSFKKALSCVYSSHIGMYFFTCLKIQHGASLWLHQYMKMSTKNRFGQRLFAPCIVSTLNTLNGRTLEGNLLLLLFFKWSCKSVFAVARACWGPTVWDFIIIAQAFSMNDLESRQRLTRVVFWPKSKAGRT